MLINFFNKLKKNIVIINLFNFFSIFIIVSFINFVKSYYLEEKTSISLYRAIFSSFIILSGYLIFGKNKSNIFLYSIFGIFSKYLNFRKNK